MGYFTQILIEAKERYGYILKERGLVMRGERRDGDLNLVFRSKGAGDWDLPVELCVPGKGETGKARAEWEDVVLTAHIHSEVKLGDTGWIGFVPRHSETLEFLESDDMSDFVEGIASYLKECVLLPTGALEKKAAPEVAAAYFDFTETLGLDDRDIAFSTDGNVQTLTVEDGAGQSVSFVWTEKGVTGQVLVNGKTVSKMRAPESWQIHEALVHHFERRTDRKPK
jgi:hypothetical protein